MVASEEGQALLIRGNPMRVASKGSEAGLTSDCVHITGDINNHVIGFVIAITCT